MRRLVLIISSLLRVMWHRHVILGDVALLSGDAIRMSGVGVPASVWIDLHAKFWTFGAGCS
jgi:hypothetical protein